MITFSELRELFLTLALIGGLSGAFFFFDTPIDFNAEKPVPMPLRTVANPVVHIDVPTHNIFEPR